MQKTIFITGASSGLGKSTAKLFQSKGWRVIATMRNPEKENELDKLKDVIILPLDVTNSEQIISTIKQVTALYSVDVVMNNAGYGLIGVLESLDDEQIYRQIATNLLSVIRVSKAFTPHFRKNKSGTFINITSTFGLIGFPTCSIYSATKFAIDGFSESMAYELAQFGIQVKIIAPGGMQTDFAVRSMELVQHSAYVQLSAEVSKGYSPEQIANYSKVEDIAQIVFEAATDNQNKLRYVAGKDANALYNERINLGAEKQVENIKTMFTF
ncbi:short-subunit dehydrogenase [Flavobacterium araucananum]|uniref:Short-chain dehydrogenase/reductase n=1 Tax=Flavobacterium araucananum TaxID=946678 RepID=A0A227NEE1_9FLAO|nr:SDR family oxidoreductase [Flavobacterium araucananum]OXE95776.1 short-chain dehydrogenase/reductase [Flavobacterium araucananum]PWJ97919.1 short-subunit dehydrogenase [Flavobacterium araucananum]